MNGYTLNYENLTKLEYLLKDIPEGLEIIQKLKDKKLKGEEKSIRKKKRKKTNRDREIFKAPSRANIKLAESRRERLVINQTDAERKFKAKLKALNIEYEFQKIIYVNGTFFIVDFYIPKKDLIIELDGAGHYTAEGFKKDNVRTKLLRMRDFKYLKRLSNQSANTITDLEIKLLYDSYKDKETVC